MSLTERTSTDGKRALGATVHTARLKTGPAPVGVIDIAEALPAPGSPGFESWAVLAEQDAAAIHTVLVTCLPGLTYRLLQQLMTQNEPAGVLAEAAGGTDG